MKKGNSRILVVLLSVFLLLVGMYVYHMNTLREGTFDKLNKAKAIKTFDELLGPKYNATNINDIASVLTKLRTSSSSTAISILDSIQILLGKDKIPPLMPENYGVAPGREEIRARKALLLDRVTEIILEAAPRDYNYYISVRNTIRNIVNDSTPGQGVSTSKEEVSVKNMNDLADFLNKTANRLGLDPPIENKLSSGSTKQQIIDFKAQINAEAKKLFVPVDKNIMKLVDFSKMTSTDKADLLNQIAEDLGIGERLTLDLNRLSPEDISRVIDRLTRELESVHGSPQPVKSVPPGKTEPPGEFETGPIKGPIKPVNLEEMIRAL